MSKIIDVIGKNFALKNTSKRINGVPVEIKTYIDAETFKSIVQTIALGCFEETGYKAENREIVRRFAIIKYLTDIEVNDDECSEIFKMTQGGNWFAQIESEVVKLSVWTEIELAIDRQIDYIIATRQTAFDKVCADLSAILSTDTKADLADVKQILDGLNSVDKKAFVEAVTENVVEKTSKSKKKTPDKQALV